MKKLEELTLKELQQKLIELGMSEEDANAFRTKAAAIATVSTLESKKEVDDGKVASLEDKTSPAEDREVNKNWKNKAEKMRDRLLSQRKVSILIPLEPTERAGVVEWRKDKDGNDFQVHVSGAVESVQLNGYKYFIPKGVYTEVPQQIAEVISKSQKQTLEAGSNMLLDRIDPNTGRPLKEIL